MSMKHPQRHHDKAAQKRRAKQHQLKTEKRERRKELRETRSKQS